ncbi:MAG: DUF4278 domain-containing protein [Cyanobacteria bacterium CRU_2_1]|nr:DUF4278 domain-containing protein [Cyanobacteria bacterium RU_5_0]NJR59303.1 DUF4278 domain-containing protein [Cyanobacteria bacterium CRU_2_1]
MKRRYRGVWYESTSSNEVTGNEAIGKYRGVPVKLNSPHQAALPQGIVRFTYRGGTYIDLR